MFRIMFELATNYLLK